MERYVMGKTKRKIVWIKVSDDLKEKVDIACKERGMSTSELVQTAVKIFLSQRMKHAKEPIGIKVEKIRLCNGESKRAVSRMKVVTFKVEEEIAEKIKDKSKELGINLSELVRRAVVKFLETKKVSPR